MPVKTYRPTTPTRRFTTSVSREDITKETPEKSLIVGKRKTGGRNSTGRVTSRFIGGGHKQKLRDVDFKRDKAGVPAKVAAIEYDPNRSARIALLHYADGEKRYILRAGWPGSGPHRLFRSGSRHSGRQCASVARTFRPARWFTTSS